MKEKEHQSIEWKESWQDEYLKWICGYANAYGGTIYIGTDDDGNVVGIDNARDLLERIPNKITDTMGIIADVNLLYKGELEYLQIIVDKYPSLISFRGKYYYRSGSTMREITGKELERALLKTQGRTWDGVPLPKLTVADLKQDAIQLFKDKAVKRGRLVRDGTVGNLFITTVADIRSFIKPVTAFLFKVGAGLIAGRTGSTPDTAKKDFSTGICLFAMVTVYTKVFGIIKGTFVIPVGQPMCFHLFGDGSGMLTEEACDILKGSTFGKFILDVDTIIQS